MRFTKYKGQLILMPYDTEGHHNQANIHNAYTLCKKKKLEKQQKISLLIFLCNNNINALTSVHYMTSSFLQQQFDVIWH